MCEICDTCPIITVPCCVPVTFQNMPAFSPGTSGVSRKMHNGQDAESHSSTPKHLFHDVPDSVGDYIHAPYYV